MGEYECKPTQLMDKSFLKQTSSVWPAADIKLVQFSTFMTNENKNQFAISTYFFLNFNANTVACSMMEMEITEY